jgi:hypothetical protein
LALLLLLLLPLVLLALLPDWLAVDVSESNEHELRVLGEVVYHVGDVE